MCGSVSWDHRKSLFEILQCTLSHSGQSSLDGCRQGGFLLAHAHQRKLAPQPTNKVDIVIKFFSSFCLIENSKSSVTIWKFINVQATMWAMKETIPKLHQMDEFWVHRVPWWCFHASDHKPRSRFALPYVLPWSDEAAWLSCFQHPFCKLLLSFQPCYVGSRFQQVWLAHLDPFCR